MELNFLQLEQRRLEDLIRAAGQEGEWQRRAELSRERAVLCGAHRPRTLSRSRAEANARSLFSPARASSSRCEGLLEGCLAEVS